MAICGPGTCWCGGEGSRASSIRRSIAASPEIELAFATLFGTFGESFFAAYEELMPLEPGFHELRSSLYNLYPRLVHVRLFGAGYLAGIDATLARLAL